jgi:hypothetical protein
MNLHGKWRLPACLGIALLEMLIVNCALDIVEGAEMPGVIILDHVQKQYRPVRFDHAMHAGLAESCGKCHHQHNDKTISACKECHTLNPDTFRSSAKGFLPCSECHSDYSPDAPAMPGLKVALHKKCFQCHIGIGELGSSPRGCAETCHTKK